MKNVEADPHENAQINLDPNEAIVLFELLSRWCDPNANATPQNSCFENTAECAVLHGLLANLEKQLAAPFNGDYALILKRAQQSLADRWDYPTLIG